MRDKPIVAIDGPAGVGKTTVAKGAAKALDFALIDTGALYRAVAWLAEINGVGWNQGPELAKLVSCHDFAFDSKGILSVDGASVEEQIRTPSISRGASAVAGCAEVRQALLNIQRSVGRNGGAVIEGRDIGTVVFPDAEIKFFLTAEAHVRAERRFKEIENRGVRVALDEIEREQERRDERDRSRAIAPLKRAADAIEIQCDDMTADEVIALVVSYVQALES